MNDFEYIIPSTLDEAIQILSTHGSSARILAGGTDIIVIMRSGYARPKLVIDIKKIPELLELRTGESGLTIGAAVTCSRINKNPEIIEQFPALIDTTSLIGGIQIQGRATVGGNLCNAAPSADTVPALIVYGAKVKIVSANGFRELPVEEFCLAPRQTVLKEDEILVNLTIPKPPIRSGAKFLRFIPRNEMDIAVANAAAAIELEKNGRTCRSARIAIGASSPTPLFVEEAGMSLVGKEIDDAGIARAARIAMEAASPIDDMRGTVEHRKQLVEVLTTRTIRNALDRAMGGKT